jgi:hypothetical protein
MKARWVIILICSVTLGASVYGQMSSAADFNGDGAVAFADFLLFAGAFGTVDGQFDLNGSGGIIDFGDFLLFAQLFLEANPPPPADILLPDTALSFGGVETGTSASLVLTIQNIGGVSLSVSGISSSDAQFTVSSTSLLVAPNSREEVTVTFTPGATGVSRVCSRL